MLFAFGGEKYPPGSDVNTGKRWIYCYRRNSASRGAVLPTCRTPSPQVRTLTLAWPPLPIYPDCGAMCPWLDAITLQLAPRGGHGLQLCGWGGVSFQETTDAVVWSWWWPRVRSWRALTTAAVVVAGGEDRGDRGGSWRPWCGARSWRRTLEAEGRKKTPPVHLVAKGGSGDLVGVAGLHWPSFTRRLVQVKLGRWGMFLRVIGRMIYAMPSVQVGDPSRLVLFLE